MYASFQFNWVACSLKTGRCTQTHLLTSHFQSLLQNFRESSSQLHVRITVLNITKCQNLLFCDDFELNYNSPKRGSFIHNGFAKIGASIFGSQGTSTLAIVYTAGQNSRPPRPTSSHGDRLPFCQFHFPIEQGQPKRRMKFSLETKTSK